jgi:NAD(P)-dependent dehydrogenase (short-subunit alcohol dehydrogenase family)
MPDTALSGRSALICGASGTIGAAVASAFAAEGARICVHYHRRPDRAEALCSSLQTRVPAIALGADLADESATNDLFDAFEAAFGPADVLVNCAHARSPRHRPVREADWSDWDAHLDALRGHFNVCRRALAPMRARGFGRIILMSGALSLRPARDLGPYAATKAALNTLTRTIALEEGDRGITANVVAPGRVDDGSAQEDVALDRLELQARQHRALDRLPTPTEIAAVVVALAGSLGAQLTGLIVPVTAGELVN